jgi:hypothetical protein
VKANGAVFQNHYGLGPDGPQTESPVASGHNLVVWEYFDNTRTVGTVRPKISGPSRPLHKAAGVSHGVLLRFYEALTFEYNRIAGYRALGRPIGFLSSAGEDWVSRQLGYMAQRHQNLVELVSACMIVRGQFDIKHQGMSNEHTIVLTGGNHTVDYQVPANHKSQIALDTGGANVIGATWANAGTDLILQFATLRMVAERESGDFLTTCWINSKNMVNLINNTGLRNAGGSAFRVWESYVQNQMQTSEGLRNRGADLVFRALPDWTFKVYDGVLNIDQVRDSQAEADSTLFIPSDRAVMTPDPGDWTGNYPGKEVVIEQVGGQTKEITGLHQWKRRIVDPVAAEECHMLDNFLPVLYRPKAIYQPTVVF